MVLFVPSSFGPSVPQWLKVPERIEFKLAVLVYRCLHQTAPAVPRWGIPPVVCCRTRGPTASSLCFDIIAVHVVVPRSHLSTIGDRAFSVAAARLWNTAAERNVGIVNICFRETFEDTSLQSFSPRIHRSTCNTCMCSDFVISDTIIDLFYFTCVCCSVVQRPTTWRLYWSFRRQQVQIRRWQHGPGAAWMYSTQPGGSWQAAGDCHWKFLLSTCYRQRLQHSVKRCTHAPNIHTVVIFYRR